jgi:hypothetical protein
MDHLLQSVASRETLGATGETALSLMAPLNQGHPVDGKTSPANMNRAGMRVSEWVHLGEIAVISLPNGMAGQARLPSRDSADISAATPISGI